MAERTIHRVLTATVAVTLVAALAACADPAEAPKEIKNGSVAGSNVQVIKYDTSPDQPRVKGTYDAAIAAQLPESVRKTGVLRVAANTAGSVPLVFLASDNRTPIGVEVDVAHLVSDVVGLKVEIVNTSWENLFIGLDAKRADVGISNVGVSEERKDKYDLATYRLGLHAFETRKGSGWKVTGPADISGKKIGVGSGTLQEQVLLNWNKQNTDAGRPPAELLYFQTATDSYLAIRSGRVDAFLGPNPSATYHISTSDETEIAGTVSSSYPIEGKVGIISLKGSGLAEPLSEAINKSIADGTYKQVLAKWGLESEAVPRSEVNPPGLPRPAQKGKS